MSVLFNFKKPKFVIAKGKNDGFNLVYITKGKSKEQLVGKVLDTKEPTEILFNETFFKENPSYQFIKVIKEGDDLYSYKLKDKIIAQDELLSLKNKFINTNFYDSSLCTVSNINSLYNKNEDFLADITSKSTVFKKFIKYSKDAFLSVENDKIFSFNNVVYSAFTYKFKWSYISSSSKDKKRNDIYVHLFFDGMAYMQIKNDVFSLVGKYNENKKEKTLEKDEFTYLLKKGIITKDENNSLVINSKKLDLFVMQRAVSILASNSIMSCKDALKVFLIKTFANN